MKVVTGSEMLEIEQRAAAGGTSLAELAERAGNALADIVLEHWPDRGWLVLAGPGNNGGDGEIAAAILRSRGLDGTVYSFRREDARAGVQRSEDDSDLTALRALLSRGPAVLDCLLGTGASRAPEGRLAEIIDEVNSADAPVLAADIPTGVNPDTGAVPTVALQADRTVAFGFAKVGDVVYPGAQYAGLLSVAPLGIDPQSAAGVNLEVTNQSEVAAMLPRRNLNSNKGTYGRTLVVGGSRDFPSAPGLSSIAALRAGSGLAHAAVLEISQRVIAAHALEPIYTVLPEDDGRISARASPSIQAVLPSCDAVVFGPGMGSGEGILQLTRDILKMLRTSESPPAVVDADGLNALSRLPEWWKDAPALVATPHPGEMARLTGLPISEIQSDRVGIARRYAARWQSIVVLKGAGTVIAHPDGRARINPTGGPNLATGGTGDVLSGTIGGLIAQRLSLWDASVAGTYLHGMAGDMLAQELGDAGTLAGDLLRQIPRARSALSRGELLK